MSAATPEGLFVSGDFQGTFLYGLSIKTGLCARGKGSISFKPRCKELHSALASQDLLLNQPGSRLLFFFFFFLSGKPRIWLLAQLCKGLDSALLPAAWLGSSKARNGHPPSVQVSELLDESK